MFLCDNLEFGWIFDHVKSLIFPCKCLVKSDDRFLSRERETHLDWGVPLPGGRGPPHVVVEIPRLGEFVFLLRHLDSGILCLFQLSTFFCGTLFSPTNLK